MAAHADLVRLAAPRVVARRMAAVDKVGLVVGGGSGHEPAFGGYVGEGMADVVRRSRGWPSSRLAQGQVEAAGAMIRRALGEAGDCRSRAWLLEASVEIALAAGDVATAREAVVELRSIASAFGAPFHEAIAERADGAVRLAAGETAAALTPLRRSVTPPGRHSTRRSKRRACGCSSARLAAPSTTRIAAALGLEAACRTFRELGAAPELARAKAIAGNSWDRRPGGLTPREVEVLRLVASGKTNRATAGELVLSEKTVARHLSNIFTKLGISSRASATAYAYEHGLAAGRWSRGTAR